MLLALRPCGLLLPPLPPLLRPPPLVDGRTGCDTDVKVLERSVLDCRPRPVVDGRTRTGDLRSLSDLRVGNCFLGTGPNKNEAPSSSSERPALGRHKLVQATGVIRCCLSCHFFAAAALVEALGSFTAGAPTAAVASAKIDEEAGFSKLK